MDVSERIASLAPEKRALLERMLLEKRGKVSPSKPLARRSPADPTPLSFAQQRLWFLDQLEPGSYLFNMPVAVVFEGALNVTALEETFTALVRRHETLRTTISINNGEPFQVIAEPAPVIIPITDLTHLPSEEREPEAKRLAHVESHTPFDLSAGPLLRVSLLKLDEEQHVLLLNMHHIVSDGWSFRVLISEVAELYGAFSEGRIPELPELSIQYADYAAWQRQWLQGAVLENELAYWRKQLAGAPAMLELPIDKPRQASSSFDGRNLRARLPAELSEALKELSKQNGATLFMTLLTAYQILLHRYTGQDSIVVGTPIAGRNRPEIEGIIGFFLNSLALNTDLSGNPTFREALARVREITLGAYAHQNLPFEKILQELHPERSTGRRPLFEVFFNMLNFAPGGVAVPGLKTRYLCDADIGAKFDLELYAEDQPAGISMLLAYNADLFSAERMGELLRQYEHLLRQVTEDPEARIDNLNLVTSEARKFLPDPTEILSDKWEGSVPAKFSAHARRAPAQIAVTDKDEEWTYGELETASNQLAHYLVAAGITPGDCVAIYAHRSASLVCALLGILKAGAAFVVVDPAHPVLRQIDFVQISNARAFLQIEAAGPPADELREFVADLPCLVIPSLTNAKQFDFLAEYSGEFVEPAIGPDSLAYISFTSGTTDKPKGIRGRHGSLTHFVPWQTEQFAFSEDDRTSMLSGISHDPLHRDVFIPLQLGSRVCIPDPEMMSEPGWLAGWMKENRVTIANLTPAMGRVLCESSETLPDLRSAFYVGEALTRQDVASLRRLAPTVNCVNYYGTTETQRAVGYFVVPADGPVTEVVPLGRGIKDVQMLVMNKAGQLAGVGEVGEIYFRSPHIALGYVGDPAFTDERFVVNPFTGDDRDRLYRTGDLGRYSPDGNLEPLGRADFQVKIRGFRIELAECESVLAQHPDVAETIVVARQDGDTEKRLVAYVVIKPQSFWNAAELRAFLARRLPDYMIPAAFVRLESIPLTANRKVDRAALPAPDGNVLERSEALPQTPIEEMLAGIWAELLRLDSVGVDDNFFELGGHSLLATQVVSRAREAFRTDVPLRTLFEAPTVRAMARRIADSDRNSAHAPIAHIARDRDLPLSFAQQRLWFLNQLEPGNAAYNMPAAVRLVGQLDIAALERALAEVVRRHETLRTTFGLSDDQPVQLITETLPVTLPLRDFSLLPRTYREANAKRVAHEEANRPFDLAAGPLWRAKLIRLGADEHVFLLTLHHIISDGWSMGMLVNEVAALYQAFVAGEESPLDDLPVQYADYARWQREWLSGERLAEQLRYWKEKLEGAPVLLELPTDRPRPVVQTFNGAVTSVALSRETTAALKKFSQREGATLFMTLLAAFQTLLHRYSGQNDIVVGTPIANRTRIETESLIGCFVNTLALRSKFDEQITFAELLRGVRETTLGAYQHQELPFERIVEELQPERSLSHSPLFQVMMGLLDGTLSDAQLPGLVMSPLDSGRSAVRFDLVLNAADTGAGLALSLEYNTDLFDETTAQRMLAHLTRLLEQVVVSAEARVSDLTMLSEAEERQLILEHNQTSIYYPASCVHELFEQQAARTPHAVAVIFGDQSLTYAELNARANQLAQHLSEAGIGPGALVGLLLERSSDLVVALLGILKAGAAYLPLDPHFPAERLSLTVADAELRYLITDSALEELVATPNITVFCLDSEASNLALRTTENPGVTLSTEATAYVIYTSGSTGRPKGIAVNHRSVTNFLRSMQVEPGLTSADRILALTTLSFDIAVLELLLPLTVGASTVLLSRDEAADAVLLARALERGITVMQATPATWRMLVDSGWSGRHSLKALVGGEALSPSLMGDLLPLVGELWNMYGPTETTIWSTIWKVPAGANRVSIGKPIANTQVYVLDSRLHLVPTGIAGELYIGGAGLAGGYWKQPALTAASFIPDPFSGTAGCRMYRTGDVVRRRGTGELEYVGRADAQVKVRGFRIELGDVEAAVLQHPAVVQCVALAREWGKHAGVRLAAYVVSLDTVTAGELRAYLRRLLPEYMIPSAFVFLNELPLTPNGKVDRKSLPDPDGEGERLSLISDATQFEELLTEIWRELLGAENISAESNFFELGGHSLLATQVIARVRDAFNVELSLRVLFENPTIRQLSERIRAATNGKHALAVPAITRVSRDQNVPLSFAQQRLWFLDQLAPGRSGYNIFTAVRLLGELNVVALQRTLTEIVSRHETLRTSMPAIDGQAVQVIEAPYEVELQLTDLSTWTDAEHRERECRHLAQDEAQRPFDLARGRLMRTSLVKLSADEHVMLLTMHHIISDAWSLGVLVREVAALYPAFSGGQEPSLPELPIQYADYASWQRNWLQGDVLERQISFWKQQLEGAPPLLDLPTDYSRPPVQSFRGASRSRVLSSELTDAIKSFSRQEGATLFMTLLAVFQTLLHRYSGIEDILVSTGIANRTRAETENLIGFFVNTIIIRANFADGPGFRELLRQVREATLAAHAHQDLPFEKLVEILQPTRDPSYLPLSQVMFVLQNRPPDQAELPGLKVLPFASEVVSTKFDLIMWVEESNDRMAVSIQYATDLFTPATIDQLLEYYEMLLRGVVTTPDQEVASLPLQDLEDIYQLS